MMRQVSCPVRRGAGRKGRKDLARSLPSFQGLGVLFLGEVSSAFLPSLKACETHQFRYLGVSQQYPSLCDTERNWECPAIGSHRHDLSGIEVLIQMTRIVPTRIADNSPLSDLIIEAVV
jgi:hypothetical protein